MKYLKKKKLKRNKIVRFPHKKENLQHFPQGSCKSPEKGKIPKPGNIVIVAAAAPAAELLLILHSRPAYSLFP